MVATNAPVFLLIKFHEYSEGLVVLWWMKELVHYSMVLPILLKSTIIVAGIKYVLK